MTQGTNPHPFQNTYVPQSELTPTPYIPTTGSVPALTIPPKVAAAISQVMAGIRPLERTEKNVHGNYAFASIDDFLEMVRPLCAAAGLIIVQDEMSTEMIDGGVGRDGKPRRWLKIIYVFTLAHSSGEVWDYRAQRTAMVDASMGSQGYGAAQSYTLKLFLRSLFQIATGEGVQDDVDRQPPNPLPGKDDERQALLVSTLKIIASHTDVAAMSAWWNSDEEKALRRRFNLSPEEVEGLKAALLQRRQEIESLRRGPKPEATPAMPLQQSDQPPAPEAEYEHPGDATQRIIDNLDVLSIQKEIDDYMADNDVWGKIERGAFSKPQATGIEKAFKQAVERTTEPSKAIPPDPFG